MYSHLWSRLASALATPRIWCLLASPWGDPHQGGLQCCVCLQKLPRWAQDVPWARKPPTPSHVVSSPSLGRAGARRARRRLAPGPPPLCLVSLTSTPLSVGAGHLHLPIPPGSSSPWGSRSLKGQRAQVWPAHTWAAPGPGPRNQTHLHSLSPFLTGLGSPLGFPSFQSPVFS